MQQVALKNSNKCNFCLDFFMNGVLFIIKIYMQYTSIASAPKMQQHL